MLSFIALILALTSIALLLYLAIIALHRLSRNVRLLSDQLSDIRALLIDNLRKPPDNDPLIPDLAAFSAGIASLINYNPSAYDPTGRKTL